MCMAVVSICTRHAHERIGVAWLPARLTAPGLRNKPRRPGIDRCRVSAGAFCLREHDSSRPAVAALDFIPGRISRE